ncbi:hypothetical protein G6F37_013608 [Rhizopus arrhizus]|nr:hypothetical protein G6F38_013662 [Rhizopus arrhizus]KAG1137046.1 hypothetical protein G6F37_013608 [Rhizopus arrhizus]
MDRCKQRQSLKLPSPPPVEHIGGLPSPPVEEKKPVLEEEEVNRMSCCDIQAKIELLKEEKHRLFQLIKQMMLEEQLKKKQEQQLLIQEQEEKEQEEKKRWEPSLSEKQNYFYSRQRYNNSYTPIQHHRPPRPFNNNSRSPYSR